MRKTTTLLTTLMMVAVALAPLGSSELASTVASADLDRSSEQELLSLLGWEGNIGLQDGILDSYAGSLHGAVPGRAVDAATNALHTLQAADGMTEVFAAATAATGNSVQGEAPASSDLATEIETLYALSGAQPTEADLLDLRVATSGLDAGTEAAVASIVAGMNDAVRANGDQPAMLQAAGNLMAAIEQAIPTLQLAASTHCAPIFEDPLFFVIIAGPCADHHSVDRALLIDLGGDDLYTNNAGGADASNTANYVNPSFEIGPAFGLAGDLLGSLFVDQTAVGDLTTALTDTSDPNYVYNRYADNYWNYVDQFRDDNPQLVSAPAVLGQFVSDCLAVCSVDPNYDPVGVHDHFPVGVAVDMGGSDVYNTTEEASQGGARNAVSILADLGVEVDSYTAPNLAQGATERGVAILYEEGGDDTYNAERDAQGGFDSGYLLDMQGDDTYNGGPGTQGARRVPFGAAIAPSILYDASGADEYWADGYAQGAGNILIDGSGNDLYTVVGPNPADIFRGVGQGVGFLNAAGMLLDGAGDDDYLVDAEGGQGYGLGGYAPGALLDLSGDDDYWARHGGQGACAVDAAVGALLYDGSGNDTYTAGGFSQGSSRSVCTAYLIDRMGDDEYTSTGSNSQGATDLEDSSSFGLTGAGVLADGGGDDTYNSGDFSQGSSEGPGLGLFLDADGTDSYMGGDQSQGAGGIGVGVFIDGLQDAFRSDSDVLATLDDVSFDVNVFLPGDEAGGDSYEAGDFSQGSSGPDGSVGIFLDNDDESENGGGPHENTYSAGLYSQGSGIAGGLGVFVDREGRDNYSVTDPAKSRGYGESGYLEPSVGLFLDTDNNDKYDGTGGAMVNDRCTIKGSGVVLDTEDGSGIDQCLTAASTALPGIVDSLLFLQPGPGPLCSGTYLFCADMDGGPHGFETNLQQANPTPSLNQWQLVDQTVTPQPPGQANAYSGTNYWYVGAPGAPGVTYLGNDGAAGPGATLTSTTSMTITGSETLTYHVDGSSEAGFDFLQVQVIDVATGAATTVASLSGSHSYATQQSNSLSAFAGMDVKIRFMFISDLVVEDGTGFNLDNVKVA